MIKHGTYYLLLKLENIFRYFYPRNHCVARDYENKYLLQKVYATQNNSTNKSVKFVHKNSRLF
jgi:hypothetical protein